MKNKVLMSILAVVIISVGAFAAYTAYTGSTPPPGPSAGTESGDGATGNSSLEISDNMSDAIRDILTQLGPAPDNVVAFGMAFKRPQGTQITPEENSVLHRVLDEASRPFRSEFGNMGCQQQASLEEMFAYTEGGVQGYSADLSYFSGKAGYTEYDALGNIDDRLGKTMIHMVSVDKQVKKYDSQQAQSQVNASQVYAYWIQSLPDENRLQGRVFNRGTDDREDDPVKEGTLQFKRVGPEPSSTEEKIEVKTDKTGRYDASYKLTAGHYEVSFDAKDGQGFRLITPNWLYLPGDYDDPANEQKDWYVLVNALYTVTYEHVAKTAGTNQTVHTVQMKWEDVSIDWLTESEEAIETAAEAELVGTYCLTYDYKEANEGKADPNDSEASGVEIVTEDDMDDAESKMSPGYYPTTFNEVTSKGDGQEIKLLQVPTLSFFRGIKGNPQGYVDDGYYMRIPVEIAIFVYEANQIFGTAIVPGIFDPMTKGLTKSFRGQGWEDWAFLGKLDDNKVKGLIERGEAIEIFYEHDNGAFVKVTIEPKH